MSNKTKDVEIKPKSSSGDLISFDEFDSLFDNFLSQRWPRFLDWNYHSSTLGKEFPKIDIIDHDNEVEVQAELP